MILSAQDLVGHLQKDGFTPTILVDAAVSAGSAQFCFVKSKLTFVDDRPDDEMLNDFLMNLLPRRSIPFP